MKKLALALLLVLTPTLSHAYALNCGTAVNAFLNGSDTEQAVVVGHSAGAVDVLAGLICLTGGRTCSCLSNVITARTEQYAEAYAEELLACGFSDPAFLPAMRAARQVCG